MPKREVITRTRENSDNSTPPQLVLGETSIISRNVEDYLLANDLPDATFAALWRGFDDRLLQQVSHVVVSKDMSLTHSLTYGEFSQILESLPIPRSERIVKAFQKLHNMFDRRKEEQVGLIYRIEEGLGIDNGKRVVCRTYFSDFDPAKDIRFANTKFTPLSK